MYRITEKYTYSASDSISMHIIHVFCQILLELDLLQGLLPDRVAQISGPWQGWDGRVSCLIIRKLQGSYRTLSSLKKIKLTLYRKVSIALSASDSCVLLCLSWYFNGQLFWLQSAPAWFPKTFWQLAVGMKQGHRPPLCCLCISFCFCVVARMAMWKLYKWTRENICGNFTFR